MQFMGCWEIVLFSDNLFLYIGIIKAFVLYHIYNNFLMINTKEYAIMIHDKLFKRIKVFCRNL